MTLLAFRLKRILAGVQPPLLRQRTRSFGRMTGNSSLIGLGKSCRPNVPYDLGANVAPDPNRAPDRRPIKVGEVWENPFTGERSVTLERAWDNPASRVTGELTAVPRQNHRRNNVTAAKPVGCSFGE